jgi:hypothetical protein
MRATMDSTIGDRPIGHPGALESLIPAWGAGREFLADVQEGNDLQAMLDLGLGFVDANALKALARAHMQGALVPKGPYKWRSPQIGPNGKFARGPDGKIIDEGVRARYGAMGYAAKGQPVHHVFIHQNGLGKLVPGWVKHHPANLMAMPDAVVHGRLHGKYKGLPRYSLPERLWVGSPPWVKKAGAVAAGHTALGREAERRR